MKNIRNILIFSILILVSSASHAYWGLKAGGIYSNGQSSFGGGVVFGMPILVKGLAIEIEESGYYINATAANLFLLQTSAGPIYDFNPLITPDSNFFHPYVRAGAVYAFLFSDNKKAIPNQHSPGFFTGAGLAFNFPVISIGIETDYNYVAFGSGADNDYWSYFISGGIHF